MRQLFEQYGTTVGRDLTYLGVPRNDLDDAKQEVFLVVFRQLEKYEERGRIRSWLFSICIRVAWRRRRQLRKQREELVDCPEQAADPTQHERIVNREDLALGCQLLSELAPDQREVFWLYEVEELSMPAIARLIGCPVQTAYSRLQRARERVLTAVKRSATEDS